ncbi:hypothetical protein [Streptomyces sp. t39]|uniref:hypothetical protein n=1 Tax=Streptomyces sp. t39 TaxID=1828156 RepID=UPI0011CDA248|nr:hypothetical protein [Streptomyces sp. t39]TXS55616.1 hypothetical protein EAO77_05120 [Streptomyces sp. t39]
MPRARVRTPRLRLTAAVAVALAATAAGTVAAPAASAAPAPAVAPAVAQDVTPFPAGGTLVSAGRTGFLAKAGTGEAPYFWTGYDGTVTALPGSHYVGAAGTDTIVLVGENGTHTLRDMGTDAEPVVITTPGTVHGVTGSTLVTSQASGFHLVSKEGDEVVSRQVTGLPSGSSSVHNVGAGTFTVVTNGVLLSLVDVTTASAVATVEADNSVLGFEAVAGSPTHLAWYDYTPADDGGHFHLLDRRTGQERIVAEGNGSSAPALSDGWLALLNTSSPAGRPLLLHSLTDGRSLRVLDRADEVRAGADGTFLVRGNLAREDGIYRVSVGEDGAPTAELVASGGRLADLAVTHASVPTTVDFDGEDDRAEIAWDFNHPVAISFTLTHTATGRQRTLAYHTGSQPGYRFHWSGDGGYWGAADYSGTYTWKMTAEETRNVGPGIERTGTLTVNRPPVGRDHDANGSPDVLVRDGDGGLWAYDSKQLRHKQDPAALTPTVLGTGWNTYTLMAAPGDLGGSAADDIVARDRDGVLWLHQGDQQKLLPRTRVGGGWQIYNKITGGSDLNGDGRGDLLATDTSGVLWFYASTGDTETPFKTRARVGGGWGIYNLITAPGDIAGASGGDLLARDTSGTLWLYLGKGDGTFTARREVGGGWQQFSHLTPVGDENKDGRPDLYAIGPNGSRYYQATGSVDRPFGTPVQLLLRTDSTFKTLF